VRREGVTEAVGKLQQAGFIHNRRGRITVLDRYGLEYHACECYEAVRQEFDRLLGRKRDMKRMPGNVVAWPRTIADIRLPA